MTAVAAQNGRRADTRDASALLGRTRSVLRRTGRDIRDALAVIGELDRASSAVAVAAEDEITNDVAEGVVELLRAFRDEHPNQELEVIFVALKEGQGGDQHGRRTRSTGDPE